MDTFTSFLLAFLLVETAVVLIFSYRYAWSDSGFSIEAGAIELCDLMN